MTVIQVQIVIIILLHYSVFITQIKVIAMCDYVKIHNPYKIHEILYLYLHTPRTTSHYIAQSLSLNISTLSCDCAHLSHGVAPFEPRSRLGRDPGNYQCAAIFGSR